MLFSSTIFLFMFLPVVLAGYYLLPNLLLRNVFLFIASLFFYAWGEPVFVLVMFASIVLNYFCGLLIDRYRCRAKPVLISGLIINLGILFVFKYLMFAMENINALFEAGLSVPVIVLPLGISFFTFQSISYIIDVYRGQVGSQRNFLYLGMYIAFFPQLIAGPIVRYKDINEQIIYRKESFALFSEGVCRFITGLAKKVLIANNVALMADRAFYMPANELSVAFSWLGVVCYALQIYYDFSGYSDMAIGLAKMFGLRIRENFDYPYISRSVSEFWRRWHISLGSWFRDYVYFPMGGSRVGKGRLVLNLLAVWALTGFWHGAEWTFVIWGLMYFAFLTMEKLTGLDKSVKIPAAVKSIYTLLVVLIGWVFFRAADLPSAFQYLKIMFFASDNLLWSDITLLYIWEAFAFFVAGIVFAMPAVPKLKSYLECRTARLLAILKLLRPVVYMTVFVLCVSFIIKGAYNPFIYFNF